LIVSCPPVLGGIWPKEIKAPAGTPVMYGSERETIQGETPVVRGLTWRLPRR
jgi:hypothetical protein